MRELAANGAVHVRTMVGVYTGAVRLEFDGLLVLPWPEFVEQLHAREIF